MPQRRTMSVLVLVKAAPVLTADAEEHGWTTETIERMLAGTEEDRS